MRFSMLIQQFRIFSPSNTKIQNLQLIGMIREQIQFSGWIQYLRFGFRNLSWIRF